MSRLNADFRKIGHPVRIRAPELLSQREHAVSELLPGADVEAARLSHRLAVLRRAHLVATRGEVFTVHCRLPSPEAADLLTEAPSIPRRSPGRPDRTPRRPPAAAPSAAVASPARLA